MDGGERSSVLRVRQAGGEPDHRRWAGSAMEEKERPARAAILEREAYLSEVTRDCEAFSHRKSIVTSLGSLRPGLQLLRGHACSFLD